MSEKSFAVISVSAAVVCGVFFYPPPPPHRAPQPGNRVVSAPARTAPPAQLNANQAVERAWWQKKLAHLKPSANLIP